MNRRKLLLSILGIAVAPLLAKIPLPTKRTQISNQPSEKLLLAQKEMRLLKENLCLASQRARQKLDAERKKRTGIGG